MASQSTGVDDLDLRKQELDLKARELQMKQNEQDRQFTLQQEQSVEDFQLRKRELDLKEHERLSKWYTNPLVLAIVGGAISLIVSAMLGAVQASYNRLQNREKASSDAVVEAIKTHDPEKARENVRFFLDAGLIDDPTGKIRGRVESADKPFPTLSPTFVAPDTSTRIVIGHVVTDENVGISDARVICPDGSSTVTKAPLGQFQCRLPLNTTHPWLRVEAADYKTRELELDIDKDSGLAKDIVLQRQKER